MKVELDLSNYAIKADFKNATGVDTSKLAEKVDLANFKKLTITKISEAENKITTNHDHDKYITT